MALTLKFTALNSVVWRNLARNPHGMPVGGYAAWVMWRWDGVDEQACDGWVWLATGLEWEYLSALLGLLKIASAIFNGLGRGVNGYSQLS